MMRVLFAAALALCALPAAAFDESDLLPIDQAFRVEATAPDRDRIEIAWTIADGYYLYRHRMGVQAQDGFTATATLELPDGHRHTDEFFGEVETYRDGVEGVLRGAATAGAATATLRIRYQGCADAGVCYPPHTRTVEVALPSGPASGPAVDGRAAIGALFDGGTDGLTGDVGGQPLPPERAFGFEAIAGSPTTLLLRFTPAPGYYLYRDRSTFRLADAADGSTVGVPRWPAGTEHEDEHFGTQIVYFDQVEVPLPVRRGSGAAGRVTLEATFQGCQTDGICYPPMTRRIEVDLPMAGAEAVAASRAGGDPAAPPADAPRETPPARPLDAGLALLLALAGGLILNLMPCVLPVLSLKAVSLARSSGSPGEARAHALWYCAGVLVAFAALGATALALREAGLALGWGFQLQQPVVVAALAYVMFALGLAMSGVVVFGSRLAGVGDALTRRGGRAGDFFTGVLAVVVASPCTAPFMGAALAFAFAAPVALAMGVFLALGLGLALPFLLVGFVPALAARLPRPGAWMDTLKQLMAFPLYATAAWLAWVLTAQRGADALAWLLAGVLLLAFGLWLAERQRHRATPWLRGFALLVACAAVWPLWRVHALPPVAAVETEGAVAFTPERLATLRRDGRTVFVDMTADWCVTCKANEKRVLDTDAFRAALAENGAVYMRGDWTNVDPAITAFLEAHGAVGVPLYVVFHGEAEGRVLPTVLTEAAVLRALESAQ